jgi:hypothetical protein
MPLVLDALKRLRNGTLLMSFSSSEHEGELEELSHPFVGESLVGRSVDDEDTSLSDGFLDLDPDVVDDTMLTPLSKLKDDFDDIKFLFLASLLTCRTAASWPLFNSARKPAAGLLRDLELSCCCCAPAEVG